jgi:TrpR-related protein YerC/YecD
MDKNVLDDLFKSLLLLENINECRSFFTDLCTPAELKEMSERWRIAQLVAQEMSYRKISELTGASTATITRVARCLSENKSGYYKIIKRKMEQKNEQ